MKSCVLHDTSLQKGTSVYSIIQSHNTRLSLITRSKQIQNTTGDRLDEVSDSKTSIDWNHDWNSEGRAEKHRTRDDTDQARFS